MCRTRRRSHRLLGHDARLRLLRLLALERLNVTELTGILGIAQSGVSRHLGLLKDGGLVGEEREAGFVLPHRAAGHRRLERACPTAGLHGQVALATTEIGHCNGRQQVSERPSPRRPAASRHELPLIGVRIGVRVEVLLSETPHFFQAGIVGAPEVGRRRAPKLILEQHPQGGMPAEAHAAAADGAVVSIDDQERGPGSSKLRSLAKIASVGANAAEPVAHECEVFLEQGACRAAREARGEARGGGAHDEDGNVVVALVRPAFGVGMDEFGERLRGEDASVLGEQRWEPGVAEELPVVARLEQSVGGGEEGVAGDEGNAAVGVASVLLDAERDAGGCEFLLAPVRAAGFRGGGWPALQKRSSPSRAMGGGDAVAKLDAGSRR